MVSHESRNYIQEDIFKVKDHQKPIIRRNLGFGQSLDPSIRSMKAVMQHLLW